MNLKNFTIEEFYKYSPKINIFNTITRHLLKSHMSEKKCLIFTFLIAFLCLLVFLPLYPGNLSDSDIYGYWSSANGTSTMHNWHPPFVPYFWRFLGWLGGLFLFNLACYWVGLALTAFALFRNIYSRILFLIIIGFFPANLQYVSFMFDDALIYSNLIMAFSLIFTYIFKVRKSIFLWLSLLFLFIVSGMKQNMFIYNFLPILFISYLILKHYVRYYKILGFNYKRKVQIASLFFIIMMVINGTVVLINKQYSTDQEVFWRGTLDKDFANTSIIAKKNLYYPQLNEKEFQGTGSKDFWEIRHGAKNFGQLTINDKLFILNQLGSNFFAYLIRRLEMGRNMLLAKSRLLLSYRDINSRWNNIGEEMPLTSSKLANKINAVLTFLELRTPVCYTYYLMSVILFIVALLQLFFFKFRNKVERILILILTSSSFLLFFSLLFLSPTGRQIRYHLPAIYSAQMSSALFLRSIFNHFHRKSFLCLRNHFVKYFQFWSKFVFQRIIYIVAFFALIVSVIFMTKHNKYVLYNHYYVEVSNARAREKQLETVDFARLLNHNTLLSSVADNKLYRKNNMLIYQQSCNNQDNNGNFFLKIFPDSRFDLYLGQFFKGYDQFNFSFARQGKKEGSNCFVLTYLPNYKINSIITGQQKNGKVLWETKMKL